MRKRNWCLIFSTLGTNCKLVLPLRLKYDIDFVTQFDLIILHNGALFYVIPVESLARLYYMFANVLFVLDLLGSENTHTRIIS